MYGTAQAPVPRRVREVTVGLYNVRPYEGSRFWGVWDASGALVVVAVYKRGAVNVAQALSART
jgi:hypothetical protein